MDRQEKYIVEYAMSHQNPTNKTIHMICVPAIFFATVGLLWFIPVGQWLGLEGNLGQWVNGATVLAVLSAIFYLSLSAVSLLVAAVWFALSVGGIFALQMTPLPVVPVLVAIWVLAWIWQFYGHKLEGASPSFFKDLLFLLVGPLYVTRKLVRGDL